MASLGRNLGEINGVIRSCRAAVESDPNDLSARAYLLDAYQDKVEFLGNVIDMSKKTPSAKAAGSTIL